MSYTVVEERTEWATELLDMDAYFARIAYDGQRRPTAETLREAHLAHIATIPFENLNIPLGRGISLEMEDLQEKLIHQQRGGYCFEHNILFSAVLERLGFPVQRLAARVRVGGRMQARSHMMLIVEADGAEWLADVGFGSGLLEPLPFQDGATMRQGEWTYGLQQQGDRWTLRSLTPDGWVDLYEFTREPQNWLDYVMMNHYTSTHPDSHFVSQLVAIRATPTHRQVLRGDKVATVHPDGRQDVRDLSGEDLDVTLQRAFGINLSPAELERLRNYI